MGVRAPSTVGVVAMGGANFTASTAVDFGVVRKQVEDCP